MHKSPIDKKEKLFALDLGLLSVNGTRYSLVKLIPKTERKHQLRRHLKDIFHPIVGDTKYGRGEHNKLFREKFDCHRLLLHASKIEFTHPVTKEKLINFSY